MKHRNFWNATANKNEVENGCAFLSLSDILDIPQRPQIVRCKKNQSKNMCC